MAKEILIADSDKADQEEFQRIFETTDYHLIFSESGEDALLRAKLFKPDMIIASGTSLQEMGGLELCGALKGDPDFKHIPFILISSIFDEISEKDRQHVQANGVISKPLNEDEILNLVDHLMEEEAIGKREEMVSEKREEFLLGEGGEGEGEEEIIELVDVVEEPEPRMSIDNFIASGKEEPFGEITPLEPWEKLELEEKPEEKEFVLQPDKEEEVIREMDLQLKREMPPKGASPEEELFEKIELEEILEKVEQLKPFLEKEWPSEKEVRDIEEKPFTLEEPAEKYLDLEEFETALQKEVKAELPGEEVQPFFIEEPKKKISEEAILIEESVEEEELKELPEEEFPDELLEEILGEEEISAIEEPKESRLGEVRPKERKAEEVRIDRLEEVEAPKIPLEEVPPLVRPVDKKMQEVISQRIQEMMEEIITKLVPEMTQNVVGLTMERIEKMVREVVPDLAEKAIQEEIKRLQKGDKD
jgi:CheY-like chemotaxis protein